MRFVIVGGTRFIGRAAAHAALAAGHEVVLLHRGEHPAPAELLEGGAVDLRTDRNDARALRRALAAQRADVIVDTCAMTRAHAEGLVAAADGVTGHAVVLSSQDVYAQFGMLNGLPAPAPEPVVTEASPLTVPFPFRSMGHHPGGPDYDKKDVEQVVRDACGRSLGGAVVLRLPAVYGPHDPQRRFGGIVDALDRGATTLPHRGGAGFRWTHAHVKDVADAILRAAEARPAGARVYNVGEPETPSMRERAEALARAMQRPLAWRATDDDLPAEMALLGEMPTDLVVSSSAIRDELGVHEVTSPAERLMGTIAWLRESRATAE